MSNQGLRLRPQVGEVEHTNFLSEDIGALYLNDEYSDVTLVVDGQEFRGHKVILASRSNYFRALLFGGMKESQQDKIILKGTSLSAFKALLKYIYTGHMSLTNLKEEGVLDILGLAHQYGFVNLESAISEYLESIICIKNVCIIYDMSCLYQLSGLSNVCSQFMDKNASEIMRHESFFTLSPSGLKDMISRDSFCAPEVDIFCAVSEWIKQNPDASAQDVKDIRSAIRLPLMNLQDLLNVVRPSNLISPDCILDAIKARTECRDIDLKYRGYLIVDENVAHPRHGSQVIFGEMRTALLDGDIQNYDMERGFTRHAIDDHDGQGILIKLGTQCIINHMRMLLWDKDMRSYSYYIEMSMDQKDWVMLVDYSRYFCRSWQYIFFPPRVVRYIRIVGSYNTVNRMFHVVSFEALYTNKDFKLEKSIVVPKENVATIKMSACVVEGVSRNRNALLNGDVQNYDWDSGYTCHQLGSGSIVVQLGQPYMIDSMRLLLWDCDDRSYSYFIETSVNQREWELVWDKSREPCRSWQLIRFERRPVVFIRIVGTKNTANEVFHCVHFECPAQTSDPILLDACPASTSAASESANSTESPAVAPPSPPSPSIGLADIEVAALIGGARAPPVGRGLLSHPAEFHHQRRHHPDLSPPPNARGSPDADLY